MVHISTRTSGRRINSSLWLVTASCLLMLCGEATAEEPPRRPNLVVLLADDLGYGDLGCYGHPHITTPHLDRLAARGARLTACYAGAPVCSPSRVALLTGRNPYRAGVVDWIPDQSPMHLRSSELTIANVLKQQGYRTAHFGKWHCNGRFNQADQPQPGDHGFEYWLSTQNNAAPSHHNPVNFVRNGTAEGPRTGYSSDLLVEEALAWLERMPADEPICLFVWFHSPHEPIATAAEYSAKYRDVARSPEEAEYFGNVTQLDAAIGRLLERLDRLRLPASTLTLFSSDNGPEGHRRYKTAQRSWGVATPLRDRKLFLSEGGIRVPGIVSGLGIPAGKVVDLPVGFVDLLPTAAALSGARLPPERRLDGQSLVPLLQGETFTRTQPLFWRYDRALGAAKLALRDGKWKLLATAEGTPLELFDLSQDVSESRNLLGTHPEVANRLSTELVKLNAEVEEERPRWPESRPTSK